MLKRGTLSILILAVCLLSAPLLMAAEVPLVSRGGTYELPVKINGVISLNFVVDSGASEVNIPADVVLTLIRTGTIRESDFLSGKTYSLADGSTVKSPRFTIRELEVGGHKVYNIPASVGSTKGDLLLGQSFLSRTASWSIDNQRRVFVFSGFLSSPPAQPTFQPPTASETPGSISTLSANDIESIKQNISHYYGSVQQKQIDAALNHYSQERRPQIKRNRLEAVAKDTERYTIQNIQVVAINQSRADAITRLVHKKYDQRPEAWEITLQFVKEGKEWKIIGTPGKKVSEVYRTEPTAPIISPPTPPPAPTTPISTATIPRNPSDKEVQSLKKSVNRYLSSFQSKEVDGVIACWKQAKRKDISVHWVRNESKSIESYTLQKIFINAIEGSNASLSAYVVEKKYNGQPETYKMEMTYVHEGGEWKIGSIIQDKVEDVAAVPNSPRANGRYILTYSNTEWGELRLSQIDDDLVSITAKIVGGNCEGEVQGIGSLKNNAITKFRPLDKERSGSGGQCDLAITLKGDSVQIDERNCLYYHGAGCAFEGSYKKIGVEISGN